MARNALEVLKISIDVLCRRAVFEVDDLRAAIDRVRPDAMIVDANCWGAISVADALDVPWLVFSPFTPYLRSGRCAAIRSWTAPAARCPWPAS